MNRRQYDMSLRLRRYLGSIEGVRLSAAEIARELPTLDRRTPITGTIVREMMASFVAAGLAVPVAGPRGGAGWALTAKGQALVEAGGTWSPTRRQKRRWAPAGKP